MVDWEVWGKEMNFEKFKNNQECIFILIAILMCIAMLMSIAMLMLMRIYWKWN